MEKKVTPNPPGGFGVLADYYNTAKQTGPVPVPPKPKRKYLIAVTHWLTVESHAELDLHNQFNVSENSASRMALGSVQASLQAGVQEYRPPTVIVVREVDPI